MRKLSDYILLFLKGMGMGAADVVPGVSGGTIAFITGIYEELVKSIKSIDIEAFRLLIGFKLKQLWDKVNGSFLLVLLTGILLSVFSLAKLLKWLMVNHPVLIWSFFFGLIIASAIVVLRKIKQWNLSQVIGLIAGTAAMYLVTGFTPASTSNAYWYIFISGAIAICAMVLPGISGAFILLLLGKYQFMLGAVSDFNISVIMVFALGAIVGLLSFANLLSWLFGKYHDLTISVLAGFIIGSLNKIWPWKETLSTSLDSHGDLIPVVQKNILPGDYHILTGNDPSLLPAIILILVAFILVLALDAISRK